MNCCNAVVRCLDLSPPHPQQWLGFATDNFIIIADFFAVCKSTILKTSVPSCTLHSSPDPPGMNEGTRTLSSDHHHTWAPFVRPGRDNPWYLLTITRTLARVVTSDNLSPGPWPGERTGEATQPGTSEINCLNKNLRRDRLGNRCPKRTLQVTLIDLYLIYCYNQRRVCIANIFLSQIRNLLIRIVMSLTTYHLVKTF